MVHGDLSSRGGRTAGRTDTVAADRNAGRVTGPAAGDRPGRIRRTRWQAVRRSNRPDCLADGDILGRRRTTEQWPPELRTVVAGLAAEPPRPAPARTAEPPLRAPPDTPPHRS
ncbi:hypothetical protein Kpho02_34540 [Kitasatospora phosalacinea]|uniref:Uncharacterized protein n=1 Tax=Kitasatospora phosalacinea TaxID=2065 RepID=A0A9W6Q762_9ACTN|nr:hypothetical protein Kpho02_34540 [Kitasatospora phosalacinea]